MVILVPEMIKPLGSGRFFLEIRAVEAGMASEVTEVAKVNEAEKVFNATKSQHTEDILIL